MPFPFREANGEPIPTDCQVNAHILKFVRPDILQLNGNSDLPSIRDFVTADRRD